MHQIGKKVLSPRWSTAKTLGNFVLDGAPRQAENHGRVDQLKDGREGEEEGDGRLELQGSGDEVSLRHA